MSAIGLTKRQRELLDYIEAFIQTHRYSPSYREISIHFKFSSLASVYKHLKALKKKGAIVAERYEKRALALAAIKPAPSLCVDIPLIGYISAGLPIETLPQSISTPVPHALAPNPEKTYLLKARGDSLEEEMIVDGDLLLVEAQETAQPGETVIALVNQQDMIIKRYYPEGTYVRLMGHYARHQPITLRQEDIRIQGILIGLLRSF